MGHRFDSDYDNYSGLWCNGSTADSESASLSSSLGRPIKKAEILLLHGEVSVAVTQRIVIPLL